MKNLASEKFIKRFLTFIKKRIKFFRPEQIVISLVFIILVFIFICFSIYLHPENLKLSFHFFSEIGAVTIFSASLLSISGLMAYACILVKKQLTRKQVVLLILIAFALTFLAVDEVMQYHEQIGEYLKESPIMHKISQITKIRGGNDMIVILYGIMALLAVIYFFPIFLELPFILEYFSIAFICYVIHTLVDSFVEPPSTPSHIIEESMKLYASVFVMLGLTSLLIFLVNKQFFEKETTKTLNKDGEKHA